MLINNYHKRARQFILSLIRQRDFLLMTHKSKRFDNGLIQDLSFLRLHIDVNKYDSDDRMARFFTEHQARIRNLIPGKDSPVHASMMHTFRLLTAEGHAILTKDYQALMRLRQVEVEPEIGFSKN